MKRMRSVMLPGELKSSLHRLQDVADMAVLVALPRRTTWPPGAPCRFWPAPWRTSSCRYRVGRAAAPRLSLRPKDSLGRVVFEVPSQLPPQARASSIPPRSSRRGSILSVSEVQPIVLTPCREEMSGARSGYPGGCRVSVVYARESLLSMAASHRLVARRPIRAARPDRNRRSKSRAGADLE